ncbi:ABC transporter permease [Gorillibacterium sp. sgz500922]|uniref:ABC transporter permease n=1 Tax=Gorillibacterium sp. sgz500922 TaxID=3446694 RepID=UPI003F66535E
MSKKSTQKKARTRWTKDDTELALLALPTTVWYILFSFLPMFGIIIAFKDFRIKGGFLSSIVNSSWAGGNGLKNFESLFHFGDIGTIIRNTLLYNIVFIILGIVIPVVLALAIYQLHSRRATKVYQTALFMPYFLSWVVVAAIVFGFLSYDKGLLNQVVEQAGGERIQWYMQPRYWPYLLTFMNVWKSLGYGMVVYLAAIVGIDSTYYEAAVIDGASKWHQMKYITLPLMKPVIIIMFILSVGRIFYSDFGLFYQVPQASNSLFDVTYTIDVYVYSMMKSGTTGMASAAAFIQSTVGCLTILAANAVVKKIDPDSAMI